MIFYVCIWYKTCENVTKKCYSMSPPPSLWCVTLPKIRGILYSDQEILPVAKDTFPFTFLQFSIWQKGM
jgi:hypothetical protein